MRPVDPRLLRYARSTRGFLVLAVVLGAVVAALVIAQARLLATAIVEVAQGRATLTTVGGVLIALAAVFLARAMVSWIAEAAAYRTAAKAKAELRAEAIEHILRLGPLGPAGRDPGAVAALVTRGVDALDAYFSRYLPQLVLAVIVPLAVLVTVLGQDLISAVIIAVTLPLIPVFMILIGLYTRTRVDRQWETLSRLSGHFLDLVAGLPTLRIFGRAKRQAEAIRSMGERYRSTTMGVLRITFLSSFALELLASLSVALVAVTMGVRLVEGQVTFSIALFVLILAPEAYLPIRLVGQHFHAAAEGLGAAEEVIALLEQEVPAGGTQMPPPHPSIHIEDVGVTYVGRDHAALSPTTAVLPPGTLTALVGASGGGKSTLMAVLLGFVSPTTGRVRLDGLDLSDVDLARWRGMLGWVPQHPHLISPGHDRPSIRDAVRLGASDADDARVERALADAGILAEVQLLPDGLDTAAADLSAGQSRRIALARALLPNPPVLLLDEPTASLDGVSEQAVVEALLRARDAGRTVIVVAHRPAVVDVADIVVHVGSEQQSAPSPSTPHPALSRMTVTARDF
jgi:ATP-binding cassette subfamily C protein CydCD